MPKSMNYLSKTIFALLLHRRRLTFPFGEDNTVLIIQKIKAQEDQLDEDSKQKPVGGGYQPIVKDLLHYEGSYGHDDDSRERLLLSETSKDEGEDDGLAERTDDQHRDKRKEVLVLEEGVTSNVEDGYFGGVPAQHQDGMQATDGQGSLHNLGRGHQAWREFPVDPLSLWQCKAQEHGADKG